MGIEDQAKLAIWCGPFLNHALRPDRLYETGNEPTKRRKLKKEDWQLCDGELYRGMLRSSLYEFGVVALGCTQHSSSETDAFCVTELGASALAHWHSRMSQATFSTSIGPTLIIQPTYQMLVLLPDLPTLYRLLPFSQIIQIAQVSKLILTQASIRDALKQGWNREKILTTLRELSAKEVPQNVAYILEEWCR